MNKSDVFVNVDILEYFNQDTKLCAEQLSNLPASFEAKYLIVEGIINNMLLLPHPRHHFILYGKLIVELFRRETKRWPRVVGPLINQLYVEIQHIDTEARDRFIDWFSFHLANFNYQYVHYLPLSFMLLCSLCMYQYGH